MIFLQNAYRSRVFANNWEKIHKHNKEAAEGTHTYTLGINQFADLTEEEWRETLTLNIVKDENPKKYKNSKLADLPEKVDWRDQVI